MTKRHKQIELLKDSPKAYGGDLLKARKGRSQGRPLDTRNTMHLILRSTKAIGHWSFWKPKNKNKIKQITSKFAQKYGIKILSMANVGNHLHFQIKLSNRFTYEPFIRAITSAIAMAVTGVSRIQSFGYRKSKRDPSQLVRNSFWDRRPFTRVVKSLRAFFNLRDYIEINRLEGFGLTKDHARFYFGWNKLRGLEEDTG